MKRCTRNWPALWLALMVTLLGISLPATAQVWSYVKIDPDRHNDLTDMFNVVIQQRMDTTWAYKTLTNGQIDTSAWIETQGLYAGYPSLANYIIDLDSGSVDIWFEEWHGVKFSSVRQADSAHVLVPQAAPLTTAGQWGYKVPFIGGKRFRVFVRSHSANTGYQAMYETMRQ